MTMTQEGRIVFRALTIVTVTTLLIMLAVSVWNGYLSPSCETLYNQYTHTNNLQTQADIFDQGIEKGCWEGPQ